MSTQPTQGVEPQSEPQLTFPPARCCEMSQFWQKTQRRLHMLKNTVPLPCRPCSGCSSAKCGATVDTSALRPTLHIPSSSFSLVDVEKVWKCGSGKLIEYTIYVCRPTLLGLPAPDNVPAAQPQRQQTLLIDPCLLTLQFRGQALQSASSASAAASLAGMRPRACVVTATGV